MKQVLILFAILVSHYTHAQKPSFSGDWLMDKQKTDFHGLPASVAIPEFKIEQKKVEISIQRVNGNNNPVEILPFNGSPIESLVSNGIVKKTSTLQWLEGSGGFRISSDYQPKEGDPFKATETWTLSNDGKVLTIARKVTMKDGDYSITAIYNKQ